MTRWVALSVLTLLAVHASAFAGDNPYFKVAVHVQPHQAGLTCETGLPAISGCEDIVPTYPGCGDVDAFVVFFGLVGYRLVEYGLDWPPEWGSGQTTTCGDLVIGDIVNPGDGLTIAWTECHPEGAVVAGWTTLAASSAGRIDPVTHPGSGRLQVIDCSFEDDEAYLRFSAGACGAEGDDPCSMTQPYVLLLDIEDDVGGGCAGPGQSFTYTITYGNDLYSPGDIHSCVITDSLPAEVAYISSTGGGVYDEPRHTVTWAIGSLSPGSGGSVEVVVEVDPSIQDEILLTSPAWMDCDETETVRDVQNTLTCAAGTLVIEKVDDVAGVCVEPGDSVVYTISYGNYTNPFEVTNIILTDSLPGPMEFISASGSGTYEGAGHSVTWMIASLGPGEGGSQNVLVRVSPDCAPGEFLLNRCAIDSDVTPRAEATAATFACGDQYIALYKAQDITAPCIHLGDTVTYTIQYSNIYYPGDLTNVVLTDRLPYQVEFLWASDGGAYVAAGHRVVWTLAALPQGAGGERQVAAVVKPTAPVRSTVENACIITSSETPATGVTASSTVCSQPRDPQWKAAVHVLEWGGGCCDEGLPLIEGCEDIVTTYEGCGEIYIFPVFYDLTELAGIQYGLTWPQTWGSCTFTRCAGDFSLGGIVNPGDGVSFAWEECQAVSVVVTGYGLLTANSPGEIRIVANPSTALITATDCDFIDVPPAQTFYAGVCGIEGQDPCGGTVRAVPTTWGQIKAMFK
jgi:uncharacterized repeat protein (TIGR01451 family)